MPPEDWRLSVNLISRKICVRLDSLFSESTLHAEQLVLEVDAVRHDVRVHLELPDGILDRRVNLHGHFDGCRLVV